jgi:hypothetical protein
VDRLKILTGWLMLVIWLPATSLCLVERAGWLSADECCQKSATDTSPANSTEKTACCALGSSSYKANENERLLSLPFDFLATLDFVPASSHLVEGYCNAATQAPPDLSVTWQFSFRTALPPRAPSPLS